MNDTAIESLRKKLRLRAKAATGEMSVAVPDMLALLDEVGRLVQANDRLRRQNRRLRLKGSGDDRDGGGASAGEP